VCYSTESSLTRQKRTKSEPKTKAVDRKQTAPAKPAPKGPTEANAEQEPLVTKDGERYMKVRTSLDMQSLADLNQLADLRRITVREFKGTTLVDIREVGCGWLRLLGNSRLRNPS
jgi:hypothetical protein